MSEIRKFTVEFLKVLADYTRLDILELLKDKNLNQEEIKDVLDKSQSTISQHLKTLTSINLIEFDTSKKKKYYKIKNQDILKLLSDIISFVIKINKEKIVDLRDLDVLDTLS